MTRDELIPCPCTALLSRFANGADKIAFALAPSQFGSDAEQRRERDVLQELPGVPVDPVGETRIALCVGCRDIVDADGRSIGQDDALPDHRSEEHTSELQSLMRISYAVFCLQKKTNLNSTPLYSTPQHTIH